MPACVSVHMYAGTHRGQKTVPEPLELDLQTVNCLMGVMETELWTSAIAANALSTEPLFSHI